MVQTTIYLSFRTKAEGETRPSSIDPAWPVAAHITTLAVFTFKPMLSNNHQEVLLFYLQKEIERYRNRSKGKV